MPIPFETSTLTLDALPPGSTAVVETVDGGRGPDGASAIEQRLRDLGLVPGTTVQVLRRAPLGDPTEYELRGYRLCLRRSEAARVRVRAVAEPVPARDEERVRVRDEERVRVRDEERVRVRDEDPA